MSNRKVVEYKKHLTPEGLVNPSWLIMGDAFYNENNKTYIGLVLDETDRDYYIPDSVKYLTKEEFKERLEPMHQVQPFRIKHKETTSRIECTIEEFVDYWWNKYCNINLQEIE
jgi:hypothetical protein